MCTTIEIETAHRNSSCALTWMCDQLIACLFDGLGLQKRKLYLSRWPFRLMGSRWYHMPAHQYVDKDDSTYLGMDKGHEHCSQVHIYRTESSSSSQLSVFSHRCLWLIIQCKWFGGWTVIVSIMKSNPSKDIEDGNRCCFVYSAQYWEVRQWKPEVLVGRWCSVSGRSLNTYDCLQICASTIVVYRQCSTHMYSVDMFHKIRKLCSAGVPNYVTVHSWHKTVYLQCTR